LYANQATPQFIEVLVVNDGSPVRVASLDFFLQVGDGQGATPAVNSVDLISGTVFDGNNGGQAVYGGNKPQSQYHVVMKAESGAGTGPLIPNGTKKLATVGIITAGAGIGSLSIMLGGTELGDTDFVPDVADLSSPATLGASVVNRELTLSPPPPPPTAARLDYFVGQREKQGTLLLRWKTLVEVDVLGFRLERLETSGTWMPIGTSVIPATGQTRGAHYAARDQAPPTQSLVRYRLLEVDLRGTEHVLAETPVGLGVWTRLAWGPQGLTLELRGQPHGVAVLEVADSVLGPWIAQVDVQLDSQGSGIASLGVSPDQPQRFFRVLEQ